MKTLVIVVIVILCFNVYSLFITTVPDAVKMEFEQKFPDGKNVSWALHPDKEYEADFSVHGMDTEAYFTVDGKWIETKTDIDQLQLPGKVSETIFKDQPHCVIEGVKKIEEPQNVIFYKTFNP